MRMLVRRLAWWIADYAYAASRQARSLFGAGHPERYESGALNPVVVLPGIWETWAFMRPLVERLHDAGYPVYVVSSLGRNRGAVGASAVIVAEFVESRDLRDVLIVAHSKGGMIGKYAMALLDGSQRIRGMVAVCAPFSGSRYARFLVLPSLRALSPNDATTVRLTELREVNARIVSVYGEFDPHIPEGSALEGADNVELPTGGHFRLLGRPETVAIVLDRAGGEGMPGESLIGD
jgi:triacylglycerol lipase